MAAKTPIYDMAVMLHGAGHEAILEPSSPAPQVPTLPPRYYVQMTLLFP